MNLFDTPEWKRGTRGENAWESALRDQGYYVTRVCDASSKKGDLAPMMRGERVKVILPDLMASKNGRSVFVEIKTKTSATYTYSLGRYEHGIERRHWEHYCRCQHETGIPFYLGILEEDTGQLLVAPLKRLAGEGRENVMRKEGDIARPMIYWPRELFSIFATVAPLGDKPRPPATTA